MPTVDQCSGDGLTAPDGGNLENVRCGLRALRRLVSVSGIGDRPRWGIGVLITLITRLSDRPAGRPGIGRQQRPAERVLRGGSDRRLTWGRMPR